MKGVPATLQPFVVEADADGVTMRFAEVAGSRAWARAGALALFGPFFCGVGPLAVALVFHGLARLVALVGGAWDVTPWLEWLLPVSFVVNLAAVLAWMWSPGPGCELVLQPHQLTLRQGGLTRTTPLHHVDVQVRGGVTTLTMGSHVARLHVAAHLGESMRRMVRRARARRGSAADVPGALGALAAAPTRRVERGES